MRLAILGTRGIPALYGGFETFAEELSVRLVQRGLEVTVYCESGEGKLPVMYQGVHLVHIPAPRLGSLTTIFFDLRCLWHARKSFDVIYMLGYGASIFCFIPRLWRSTVWINMDGIEWARAKWGLVAKLYFKIMEAIAVRVPDRMIMDAEGIKEFLQLRHSFKTPCSVIPYGGRIVENAPAAVLNEYGLRPFEYYLIVCRLEPENHVLEILRGFAASQSACRLVVIGNDRAETSYVEKLKLICDERITFVGVVYDNAKLSSFRYYCKAYIHGHSVGGTNPSLLEALGCGNIVIAHDNAFNREVVGEFGILFKTVKGITACVERIDGMANEDRARIAAAARLRIRDCYNWEMITDQYSSILKQ